MRSYVVKRRLHFKHSRRRRIVSPPRPSRESITLSSTCPQKGHFTGLSLLAGPPLLRSRLLSRVRPSRATSRVTFLRGSGTGHRQDSMTRSQSTRAQWLRRLQAPFLPQISSCRQELRLTVHHLPLRAIA